MVGAKDISTPLSISHSLQLQDDTALTDCSQFRRIIRSLQYLSFTCPDICFVVNKLSQFMHKPSQNHWTATKHLPRYLKRPFSMAFKSQKLVLLLLILSLMLTGLET
jgi:hypothetical protein